MLLIDDLLAAPVNGILWVFKEIQKAASEEQRSRRDQIMAALSGLYVRLEQGQISESDFDAQEQDLLDELDRLDAQDTDDSDAEDADQAASVYSPGETSATGTDPSPEYALKIIPPVSDSGPGDEPGRSHPGRAPEEDPS